MSTYTLRLSEPERARYRMMAQSARQAEADLWRAAGIVEGAHVADVGCGPGAVLALIAEDVGPSGYVTGVDSDAEAVAAAQSEIVSTGLRNAAVRVGTAQATGLEPASLDVAVLRHVLAHNGGIEHEIVGHLATLVRPGGAVYLVDVDLTATRLRPVPPELADLVEAYVGFHRHLGNDPQVGLRLADLATDVGLVIEDFRGWYTIMEVPPGLRPPAWAARDAMVDSGVISRADVERWGSAFQRLDDEPQRPRMFAAMFAAVCRRPDS